MAYQKFKAVSTADGDILSQTGPSDSPVGDYSKARQGTGSVLTPRTSDTMIYFGQTRQGNFTSVYQAFVDYTLTAPSADDVVTSAELDFEDSLTTGGDTWSAEVREKEWLPAITADDFVAGTALSSLPLIVEYPEIRTRRPQPSPLRSGSAALRARLSGDSSLQLLFHSDKQRTGVSPSADTLEYARFRSYESGVINTPTIAYSTATKNALLRVVRAQVQLSDGTTVWLDADTPGAISLKHNPSGSTYNTVASLSIGSLASQFRLADSQQAFSIARDSSDNIYVVGAAGPGTNQVLIQAFDKGSGYTWTAKTALLADLPDQDGPINSVAMTWNDTGGAGHLAVMVGHARGTEYDNLTVILACSASVALAGSGVLVTATAIPSFGGSQPDTNSGTGMDIMAWDGGDGIWAGIRLSSHDLSPTLVQGKYTISSLGALTIGPGHLATSFSSGDYSAVDGNYNLQLVYVNSTRWGLMFGRTVDVWGLSGSTFSRYGGSAPLPSSNASIGTSTVRPMAAIYDPASGKIWAYYTDATNSRRVARVGRTLISNAWDAVETEVSLATGDSGSTNLAIRLPRGSVDERRLLVQLGNKTAGGVHSTVTVVDTSLNQAPNAPVLIDPGLFSASVAKNFMWTFSDPNALDTQSAYQLQVRDQSTGVDVYDSTKVTSSSSSHIIPGGTLSNSEVYEWRVRTYDPADQAGSWSSYSTFSTVSSGVASIIDPPADNIPLSSPTLQIEWQFSVDAPLSQAGFRIRVYRTDSNALLFDTGDVSDPVSTTYTLFGLLSDVEQRIDLVVRDSGAADSNTASRLVTPSYLNPATPSITAAPTSDGSGVLVTVTNPSPTGDTPEAVRNDIYRAIADSGEFVKVGETLPGNSFVDYGAAADVYYDYLAYAVAGGQTASNIVQDVLVRFDGVMLFRADSPSDTIRQFRYGKSNKSDALETNSTELRFVGRTYPVTEFGEQFSESVKVEIMVPFGSNYQTDLIYLRQMVRDRSVYCYRDSRGRRVFGLAWEAEVTDEDWGASVGFTFRRMDYDEELP